MKTMKAYSVNVLREVSEHLVKSLDGSTKAALHYEIVGASNTIEVTVRPVKPRHMSVCACGRSKKCPYSCPTKRNHSTSFCQRCY